MAKEQGRKIGVENFFDHRIRMPFRFDRANKKSVICTLNTAFWALVPFLPRHAFLKSPETFRVVFSHHNSHCNLYTKTFPRMKLCYKLEFSGF